MAVRGLILCVNGCSESFDSSQVQAADVLRIARSCVQLLVIKLISPKSDRDNRHAQKRVCDSALQHPYEYRNAGDGKHVPVRSCKFVRLGSRNDFHRGSRRTACQTSRSQPEVLFTTCRTGCEPVPSIAVNRLAACSTFTSQKKSAPKLLTGSKSVVSFRRGTGQIGDAGTRHRPAGVLNRTKNSRITQFLRG